MSTDTPDVSFEKTEEIQNLRVCLREFLQEYDQFLYGVEFADFPQSLFVACGKLAVAIVTAAEFPADLRHCLESFAAFSECWLSFTKSETEEPGAEFHSIAKALIRASEQQPRQMEPVSLLLEQLKDFDDAYGQIARMHGRLDSETEEYIGPFFNSRGTPDIAKIQKEAAEPGSVIPLGWTPYSDQIAAKQAAALEKIKDLAKQYRQFDRESSGQPAGDPASIEELLMEGAFPDQIAMVKGCTEAHVREVAAKMGFKILERDEILNRAGQELWEAQNSDDRPYVDGMSEVGY